MHLVLSVYPSVHLITGSRHSLKKFKPYRMAGKNQSMNGQELLALLRRLRCGYQKYFLPSMLNSVHPLLVQGIH